MNVYSDALLEASELFPPSSTLIGNDTTAVDTRFSCGTMCVFFLVFSVFVFFFLVFSDVSARSSRIKNAFELVIYICPI